MNVKGKSQYAEWNIEALKQIENNLKVGYYVDVGIVGKHNSRTNKNGSSIGNASLGAIQEFGTKGKAKKGAQQEFGSLSGGIPARSWLRMPLFKLTEIYAKLISYKDATKTLTEKRGERKIFVDIGKSAVQVIRRAFNTRGYGDWEPNSPSTMLKKKRNTPLKDTRQLMDAVSYRIGKYGK